MELTRRIKVFNFFRNIFRFPPFERILAMLTSGKGYDNIFVKCLPQNYQYKSSSYRKIKRNGIWFQVDISEYMEWVIYFGLNVEERKALYPMIKKGMHILDIGTNIGETVLNFASLTGQDGKVYGFEPVKENFDKCENNISLNSFSNIVVKNIALSDKKETLYFGLSDNKNSGGIYMNKHQVESGYSVQAMPLDDFITENKILKIDFIKLDVEGFEYTILKGAEKTVNKFKPVLFIEVDELNLQRQTASAKMLIELVISFGYSISKSNGAPVNYKDENHFDIICRP